MASRSALRLFSLQNRLMFPVIQSSNCHTGTKSLVDRTIASTKVVMFSKSYCPFCQMAKDVLEEYIPHHLDRGEYDVLEIEDLDNMEHIQDYLKTLTGGSSVPRVFVEGAFIGGGTELKSLHKENALKDVLNKVKAE